MCRNKKADQYLPTEFLKTNTITFRHDGVKQYHAGGEVLYDTPSSLEDWKKQNPDKDEMDFYKEKGIAIKRIELDKGGVVSLSDYLKQKQKPKIKKIDLAQGDFEKTVASLTDSDKDLIKELLRKSGVLVGD